MPVPTTDNTAHPRSCGFDASIDTLLVRLAPGARREFRIETAELQAQRIQTAELPEEFVSAFGQTFARSDFTGGSGLDWAHQREAPVRAASRYYDSKNIDIPTPVGGSIRNVRLLPRTERVQAGNHGVGAAKIDTTLYVHDGAAVFRIASPLATSVSPASENPFAGDGASVVYRIVNVGNQLYATTNHGIHRRTTAGVWSHYADGNYAGGLWYAQGRLFASLNASLYEIPTTGSAPVAMPTPLRTLAAGQTWWDVIDAGGVILAAASDGSVFAFAPNTAGTLELKSQTNLVHEHITAMTHYSGAVFYATAEPSGGGGRICRLYEAEVSDSGGLVNSQLLRQIGTSGTTIDHLCQTVVFHQDSVYYAARWDAADIHAWKLDLRTGGLHRHLVFPVSGTAVPASFQFVGSRMFLVVAGNGLWRQHTLRAVDGYLIGPLADFYSADLKTWVGARVEGGEIPEGTRVELYYTTDPQALTDPNSSSWYRARTVTNSFDNNEIALANVQSRALAGMLKLFSDTAGNATPTVRSFSFRAFPSSPDVLIELPVNISDRIERPNRKPVNVPGIGAEVYNQLKNRQGKSVVLEMLRTGDRYRGILETVIVQTSEVPERGTTVMYGLVRVRAQKVTDVLFAEQGVLSTSTLGSTQLGGVTPS